MTGRPNTRASKTSLPSSSTRTSKIATTINQKAKPPAQVIQEADDFNNLGTSDVRGSGMPVAPTLSPLTSTPTAINPHYSNAASNNSGSTNISSTSALSSPQLNKLIVHINGIPETYATQRKLYGLLVQNKISFVELRVFRDFKATLISQDKNILTTLKCLQDVDKNFKCSIYNPGSRRGGASGPSSPTFSCVVRAADPDIAPLEFKYKLEDEGLKPEGAWRIISRRTNEPTTLIRIITKDKHTLDYMLENGILLFGRRYLCEPSRPTPAQPLQCGRCFVFGHSSHQCNSRGVCPKCGASHPRSADCSSEIIKCINCEGAHPAYSPKCPVRPKQVSAPEAAAPVVSIDRPVADDTLEEPELPDGRYVRIEDAIRFTLQILSNILPLSKKAIFEQVSSASLQFFARTLKVSEAGNKVHCTIFPSGPPGRSHY